MQRLQPVLERMCEAVEQFGGTVARTLGDGIMALFGAPRTQEGHAVLACQAALAIRETQRIGHGGLAVRCGLHSGDIVANATPKGHDRGSDAYGLTLHLGSRLPAQVEADGICLSESCYRLARAFCEVKPLGQRSLRGVPQPVALYELFCMKPVLASQQFRSADLTSFLGRHHEMNLLKEALQAANAGNGGVIGIVGAPGAGKSRLCYEFGDFCRGLLYPVFEARAQPYGAAVPLRVAADLLGRAYFGIEADEDAAKSAARVADRLTEVGVIAPADLTLVCDLLGVPFRGNSPSFLSPKARVTRLLEIVECLVRQGGTMTTVLILEDLHWLDEASEAFLAALARAVVGTRTMLLVNSRPSHAGLWMRAVEGRWLELRELTPSDAGLLVDELIGPLAELAEIRQRIATRSGGNPFFAEELVRSLADGDVLIGKRGDYQRGRTVDTGTLPPTVQAVIGARIDRLPQAERSLLHIGAVIGKEFDVAVLRRVAGRNAASLTAMLDRLCEAGLLQCADRSNGDGYGFRHPLIREVAIATQLKTQRSALHGAVARAMERLYADRCDEFASIIAYHLEEAGEFNDASFYAARAARWVGHTSASSAMRQWHKVRTLMADQPRSPANDSLRIEAAGQIAWLGWREGLTAEQAQPMLQEALAWAHEIDHSMVSLLMLVDGRIAQVGGGDSDVFVGHILRAIDLAEKKGDPGRIATLQASLSHAYGWAGLLREALAANDAALAGACHASTLDQQFLGYSVEHWARSLRGRLLLRLGHFDAARRCFDATIALKGQIDPTVTFVAHFGYVDMAWCLGDADMAAQHAGHVAELAERHGSAYLRLYQLASGATAAGIAGDFDAAIRGMEESLAFQRKTGAAIEFEPELLASFADYLQRTSDYGQAMTTAENALALARRRNARLPQCRATITLASLSLRTGGAAARIETALSLAAAERLIAESGARIYEGRLNEAYTLMSDIVGTERGRTSRVNSDSP